MQKDLAFDDDFGDGKVNSSFILNGTGPSVVLYHVSPVTNPSSDVDQIFSLALMNNTGSSLQRIDLRFGELPMTEEATVADFSEGFGTSFGANSPLLIPGFFFPDQEIDIIDPDTHIGISLGDPFWAPGLPGTLLFDASVLNTDHALALWIDVTPVPEPATGLIFLLGTTGLVLRRSRRIE